MLPPTIYTMASAGSKTCVCKLCIVIVGLCVGYEQFDWTNVANNRPRMFQ